MKILLFPFYLVLMAIVLAVTAVSTLLTAFPTIGFIFVIAGLGLGMNRDWVLYSTMTVVWGLLHFTLIAVAQFLMVGYVALD